MHVPFSSASGQLSLPHDVVRLLGDVTIAIKRPLS